MQLTFLSKTLITMGLIAALPTMVATGVQKTAQAQVESEVQAEKAVEQMLPF